VLFVVLSASSGRTFTAWIEWVLDTGSVYCEVRTEFKYMVLTNFRF